MDNPMNEEMLFAPLPTHPRQDALIVKYCADIQDRIRTADSELDASKIVESACERFGSECENHVLRSMLREYLTQLVQRYWKSRRDTAVIGSETSRAEQ
jgi:hypothetical protein